MLCHFHYNYRVPFIFMLWQQHESGQRLEWYLLGCVAIHHLDTPWRPSDLEQRNGRAVRARNEVAKHFADNKVDVIIYAVEKSLDSYKFNLLHCKQMFISQLKSGALGARTIDEGAIDEKSGMNFSEYMAILSGNTDLLDKAKLQKIAKEKDTKGEYRRVGEIHGFTILMCSEVLDKDGLGMFQNKFCVEGRSASPLRSSFSFAVGN